MRISEAVGQKGAQTVYYALGEYADTIGLPLTHMITIDFARTALAASAIPEYFQNLLTLLRKRLTRPSVGAGPAVPATYGFVFENTRNKKPLLVLSDHNHNIHVHLAVHVPAERLQEIRTFFVARLATVLRTSGGKKALSVKAITNCRTLRQYFLKGTHPAWARRYGVHSSRAQGVVPGRRSGTSRNLGPTARRASDRALGIRRRRPRRQNND